MCLNEIGFDIYTNLAYHVVRFIESDDDDEVVPATCKCNTNTFNSIATICILYFVMKLLLLVRLRLPWLYLVESNVERLGERLENVDDDVSNIDCVIDGPADAVFEPLDVDADELANPDILGEFKRNSTCNGPKSLLLVRRWRLSSIFFFSTFTTVDISTAESICIHNEIVAESDVNSISC